MKEERGKERREKKKKEKRRKNWKPFCISGKNTGKVQEGVRNWEERNQDVPV